VTAPADGSSEEPLSTLRGAPVAVNVTLIKRIGVVLIILVLVGLIVGLTIGGVHRNAQVTRLKDQGVPVTVAVTQCEVLAGGTGANPAGYSCSGAFSIRGHRHVEVIGGTNTFHRTGQLVRAVVDPQDPALLSTATAVASEHSSTSVYVIPIILLVALLGLVGVLVVRRRAT
jgi:MYXO-CTERM domain-containing protein